MYFVDGSLISIRPSIHPPIHPSVRRSVRPYVHPSIPSIYLPTYLPTHPPTYLPTHLPIYIYIYIYIYISIVPIFFQLIINRIYEHQNLLSLQPVSFLVGLRTYQHRCKYPKNIDFLQYDALSPGGKSLTFPKNELTQFSRLKSSQRGKTGL